MNSRRLTRQCSRQAAETRGSVGARVAAGAAAETFNCVGTGYIGLQLICIFVRRQGELRGVSRFSQLAEHDDPNGPFVRTPTAR